MKLTETHFTDYTNKKSLHVLPVFAEGKKLTSLNNLIIYGAEGIGKYSYALHIIKQFSPSELKYEKKINITNTSTSTSTKSNNNNTSNNNKNNFFFKLSDIHYEVDMALIGCNSKQLWNDIYLQIVDIINAKQQKEGIIFCINFQSIHSELLDIFYSYMQTNFNSSIAIRFIIITTNISFLPDNIINCCEKIRLKRPSKKVYNSTLNITFDRTFNINKITNIKDIITASNANPSKPLKNETMDHTSLEDHASLEDHTSLEDHETLGPYNTIMQTSHHALSNVIVNFIVNYNKCNFLELREMLYDLCIYDINLYSCISYIIHQLLLKKMLTSKKLNKILIKLIDFLKLYNNNYRPIYHLERYILYIISVVHEF